jgi:predicted RNA-binding Zn ribbon-like protein
MRHSERYAVPPEIALLYDFANSVDCRRYVENGSAHTGTDELDTPAKYRLWSKSHGLKPIPEETSHTDDLALRQAVRAYLKVPPERRLTAPQCVALAEQARRYPLIVTRAPEGLALRPDMSSSGLASVLAQLHRLAVTGQLERLKMCASDECSWIFFDRSKPANRRWCSSDRCGNRHKTRAYRERQRSPQT